MNKKLKLLSFLSLSCLGVICSVMFGNTKGVNLLTRTFAGGETEPQPGSITFSGSATQIGSTNKWYTVGTTTLTGATYYLIAESSTCTPASNCVASFPGKSLGGSTTMYVVSSLGDSTNFRFQSITSVQFSLSKNADLTVYDFSTGSSKDSNLSKEYTSGSKTIDGGNGHYLKIDGLYPLFSSSTSDVSSLTINFVCGEEEPGESFSGVFTYYSSMYSTTYKISFASDGTGFYDINNGHSTQYFTYEKADTKITVYRGEKTGEDFTGSNFLFNKESTSNNTFVLTNENTLTFKTYSASGTSTNRTFTKQA